VLLLYVVTQMVRIGADWWLAQWTERTFDTESFGEMQYFMVFLGIALLFTGLALWRSLALAKLLLQAATTLHNNMFARVLLAPMTFFWRNPSGRVLNRFSNDQVLSHRNRYSLTP
jgi:ATP-binding cassette subfamily C (CFTR/MRP) protein 4